MITVVGLGPGDLDRVPNPVLDLLLDPERHLIVRTLDHPAAEQLKAERSLTTCDDLYEKAESFEDVYRGIVARVEATARRGDVIYAVPGESSRGEFAVRELIAANEEVEVVPGESFLDAILAQLGYDPLDRGCRCSTDTSCPIRWFSTSRRSSPRSIGGRFSPRFAPPSTGSLLRRRRFECSLISDQRLPVML